MYLHFVACLHLWITRRSVSSESHLRGMTATTWMRMQTFLIFCLPEVVYHSLTGHNRTFFFFLLVWRWHPVLFGQIMRPALVPSLRVSLRMYQIGTWASKDAFAGNWWYTASVDYFTRYKRWENDRLFNLFSVFLRFLSARTFKKIIVSFIHICLLHVHFKTNCSSFR